MIRSSIRRTDSPCRDPPSCPSRPLAASAACGQPSGGHPLQSGGSCPDPARLADPECRPLLHRCWSTVPVVTADPVPLPRLRGNRLVSPRQPARLCRSRGAVAAECPGALWIESQNAASDLDLRHGLQSSRIRGVHAFADVRRAGVPRQDPLAARPAGYPWPEQMARKMLRNVEKRGVHAARNGPSPPPTPAGGPVAQAEMSTAERLGSREGSSRAGPPQGWGVSR